jgi:copper(I)-binding protein
MKRFVSWLAAAPVFMAVAAFAQSSSIQVENPWTRATPAGARFGMVFMTISNPANTADRLLGVSSDAADKTEIDETSTVGGKTEMHEVTGGVSVPAGGSIMLKPDGYHIMLSGLKKRLKAGDTLHIKLAFEKAGSVTVVVPVRASAAASDEMPGMGNMPGMTQRSMANMPRMAKGAMANMPGMTMPMKPPSPWDVTLSAAVMSDYNMRGFTMSNHRPSVQAGFEPHYDITPALQAYAGISGESIDFPNQAAAEIDFYGGIRPTFGKLGLDFGFWYYDYPGGQCFNMPPFCSAGSAPLANGNVMKADANWYEGYAKATYTLNDYFNFGGGISGSPSVFNMGGYGIYYSGNATLTAPASWLPGGVGAYLSADVGWWQLGTTDAFYAAPPAFPAGVPLPSYLNWDVGFGITWKSFTLDLRYYDTNLTKAQCNVFTMDQTATFSPGNVTPQNPFGLGSTWCSAAFIAKLSAAISVLSPGMPMAHMKM